MVGRERAEPRDRRLLLFKWLMVLIPPAALAIGHSVLATSSGRHSEPETLGLTVAVALLALVLAYAFAEGMFRLLRRLQAEAVACEQDVLTMNAVLQERERLSRELHDGVAQLVAHLLLRLDTIGELVAAGRPREAGAELERLRGVADEIYADVGESITGLRTNVATRGLVRELRDYAEQFEERHGVPVTLEADERADRLAPLAAFQVLRLVQEALTNVRKHARASRVAVSLTSESPASDEGARLLVVVADDGRGFASVEEAGGAPSGLGLTSMRERVEALGGTLEVWSEPDAGTRVAATIPLPRSSEEPAHAAAAIAAG
jgi:signal transduction histidine kinase